MERFSVNCFAPGGTYSTQGKLTYREPCLWGGEACEGGGTFIMVLLPVEKSITS